MAELIYYSDIAAMTSDLYARTPYVVHARVRSQCQDMANHATELFGASILNYEKAGLWRYDPSARWLSMGYSFRFASPSDAMVFQLSLQNDC